MQWFIKRYGKGVMKARAHIWIGGDTACTMATTGGLNPEKYEVTDSDEGREICTMCRTNYEKFGLGRAA